MKKFLMTLALVLTVGIGEFLSAYVFGLVLWIALKKRNLGGRTSM